VRPLKYVVYSTEACPRCEQLKKVLKGWGAQFENVDMVTPEALTELRINSVFTLSAPVLQAGENFYTVEDLFEGDTIKDLEVMGLKPK
jgi:glutaredoxin-like protein NrdH